MLVALIPAAPALADVGGVWRPLAPLATPRQELAAARIENHVYAVGGLLSGPGITATATVERYDIATNTWAFVAPLPAARHHLGVCALGGLLYAIGGHGPTSFTPTANVWSYDPATNVWTPRAALPVARGGHWAVSFGGRIYVFGGVGPGGAALRTTFAYDPATNAWTPRQDMPTAREHLTADALGSFIYVVGGRAGGSFAVNERYDPLLDQWAVLAPMPSPRSAAAVTGFRGRLYVMGGEVPVLSPKNEVYDPATNSWSAQDPMAVPRHGIAGIALDDRIFVPAGGIVQGLLPTAHADAFLPLPVNARHACACGAGAPCGNVAAEAGCGNSTGAGAELTAFGLASVSADSLVLWASALPGSAPGLFFQGTALANAGAGAPFGDGVRCASGTVVRLAMRAAVSGQSSHPQVGDAPISLQGAVPPGSTRHYQLWYRNVSGPCGQGYNLTNALSVDWGG